MAGVIKSGQPAQAGRAIRRVAFNFDDVSDKANEYLHTVRQQAEQIIADAEAEAEKVRLAAEENGRQAALQAAQQTLQEQLDNQMKTLVPALDAAVESVHQARQQWLKQWEQNAVHLAAGIARRITRRELTKSPEITIDLVREALELASGGERLKLYLNPRDLAALRSSVDQLAESIGNLAPTDIIGDQNITPGGCRLETEFGVIDQQIEAQLARIEQELSE